MALENFCECIIKTEDLEEIKQKLSELDLSLLQSRDEHGNSLLHLAIQANCNVNIFKLIIKDSNLSFRNDEYKLPQDLIMGKEFEKLYIGVIVDFMADKLCNCEGEYIRSLVIQGWDHRPYLQMAIDKLMDHLNDNFVSYLSSIENFLESMKSLTEKVVSGELDEFNNLMTSSTLQFNVIDIISFRNQCGLTLLHIAVIFERYNIVSVLVNKCLENQIKATDHIGRTALHYFYGVKSTIKEDIMKELSKNKYFDCVDELGNSPEYYELFPELLHFDYCVEFVKSDLINLDIIDRKQNSSIQSKVNQGEHDTEYLKKTVGKALVRAFALVVEKRPTDPIDFLGHFLKFYATNFDNSDYEYEILSSKISIEIPLDTEEKLIEETFTFKPEIFSPFAKVARDKHGTPLGYKLLLKKLKTLEKSEIDWFEIIKRGLNFALRDSNENTLLELAITTGYSNIKNDIDAIILNMINEENLQGLKNLYSCGYFDDFPDIYDLCGPDLFDVSQEVVDFYTNLFEEQKNINLIFSSPHENPNSEVNWTNIITNEMLAYAYNKKGMSVIHWAIASNNNNLFHYLVDYFPESLKLKDCFNRNVCHYCVAFSNKQFNEIIDEYYPEGKDELDCFDYLPEYYEFYQSSFRSLM